MKKQQFKVNLSSGQFVTIDGLEESDAKVIASKLKGNLMPFSVARADRTANMLFREISIDGIGNLPVLEVESSEVVDGIYIVKGTATVKDKKVNVLVDGTGVHIDGGEEEPEPEPETEPESEPEVVEPEPETEPEPIPEIVEPQSEEEEVVEPEPIMNKPVDPEPEPIMNEPAEHEPVITPTEYAPGKQGIVFRRPKDLQSATNKTGLMIGAPRHKKGFVINGPMPAPNFSVDYRYRPLREVSVTGRPVHTEFVPVEPEPVQSTAPIPTPEPIPAPVPKASSFKKHNTFVEMPEPEPEPEPVKEPERKRSSNADDSYKAAKEAVRAKMSPEVNAVIGDIPHAMLGDITPYTTKPIDKNNLETMQDLYCINNGWLNVGNWYCIDVVKESARYFYNSNMGVSIQIDLKTIKQWKEVVA